MGWYAISTRLIIDSTAVEDVSQVWLVDDAAGGGRLDNRLDWHNKLEDCGKKWGYHVDGSKSWLIVKPEEKIMLNSCLVSGSR